ncbi:MAG: DUF58 domain-containing protein [Bacteroidota bacterium]
MNPIQKNYNLPSFSNLSILANQVVEGFISGIHKSPFHGFSAEFAEHRLYNTGESTKHIDWKLYAKTDKLYTKRFEEETNLRCHFIIDNSSSMYYPKIDSLGLNNLNKIGFSALATAAMMNILKKQRDAAGLTIYNQQIDFSCNEKGSDRHFYMIYDQLEKMIAAKPNKQQTKTYTFLHQIAERLKRRSLVVLFSDMFQDEVEQEQLLEALRHLKYNKHQVILFHTIDADKEINFNFDNAPKKFTDVETGEFIDVYSDQVQEDYQQLVAEYFQQLKLKCAQYKINYQRVDINRKFDPILRTFLAEKQ